MNTVAWQLFEELTPKVGLQYLLNMHFSKIVKKDYTNATSIGGLTYGCSVLEMASGFATLENDGKFRDPTCIVKILDSEGNTVVEDHVDETYIYDSKAANTMVDMMEGVFTRGTARGLGLDTGIVCAGKTGTTNDHKDGWFCGFTPYYTTAVWIGCDTPTVISDLSGSTYPGRTWNTFMNEIHKDLENKVFPFEEKEESDSSDSSSSKSYSSQGYSSSNRATATPKAKKPKATKPAIVEEPDDLYPDDEADSSGDTTQSGGDTSDNSGGNSSGGNSDGADASQGGSTSNDDTTYNQDDTTYQDENNTPQQ